jgi:hypothetical protein
MEGASIVPFTNNRIYYVIGAIILAVVFGAIIVGALSNNNVTTKKGGVTDQISVTINYGVGIQEIDVTNQNTGELFQATLTNFPLHFNCTKGDNLNIKVVTKSGYYWNAMWFSPMDIWCKGIDNELTVIAGDGNYFGNVVDNGEILMTPKCNQSPPTPTPTPTASPTWGPSK